MKKLSGLIVYFLCMVPITKAQLQPVAASNVSVGCAPINILFNCPNYNSGTAIWSVGTATYSGLSTSINFATPAVYVVSLSVTQGTSQGSTTISVNVVTGPENGCATTVGLNKTNKQALFTLAPNPVTNYLSLLYTNQVATEHARYFITNNLGQVICEKEIEVGKGSELIPVTDIAPGLYQFHLTTLTGSVTKTFVKTEQ